MIPTSHPRRSLIGMLSKKHQDPDVSNFIENSFVSQRLMYVHCCLMVTTQEHCWYISVGKECHSLRKQVSLILLSMISEIQSKFQ